MGYDNILAGLTLFFGISDLVFVDCGFALSFGDWISIWALQSFDSSLMHESVLFDLLKYPRGKIPYIPV